MYTAENLLAMGKVYRGILKVLNGGKRDPYEQISQILPMKCIVMTFPRAASMHIPEDLDREIAELMDGLTPEDMEQMMDKPVPMDLRMNWIKGYMGYA